MSKVVSQELRKTTNPSFRFVVYIDGKAVGAFTECKLPTIEWEMKEVKIGGLNTYTKQVPGRRKKSKLMLKNGVGLSNVLMRWYLDAMGENIHRKRVTVVLRNSASTDVMRWVCYGCVPSKWTGPQLKSDSKAVAIQTLEFACGLITVERRLQMPKPSNIQIRPHVTPPARRAVQASPPPQPHVVSPRRMAFQVRPPARPHVVRPKHRAVRSMLTRQVFL